mmetsp:Transcript_18822/g.28037  ORF Transcript_18822/g.28037 Transcript_18822/m.28037 type:complete len:265 (+) Transcript_18822:83-877(+)|eukprot:CAMPEP_0201552802 /NCGR_PEP_ID=MMETSP0173_2-20130828/18067_1 /ASSEMBLY_ACC=CAM_ASM_000268 /TAXON_ID=218659 /ORGANISM="Vexillifera sp., Strain DIVA3 564/2" /LENGTH=264 /DNA_ID=CAMNT_0047963351 /DNA_START=66 /DNA_END=860 /DNA_ORIENTATION=+
MQAEVAAIRAEFNAIQQQAELVKEACALHDEIANIKLSLEVVLLREELTQIAREADAFSDGAASKIVGGSSAGASTTSQAVGTSSAKPGKSKDQLFVEEQLSKVKQNDPSVTSINFNHFREGGSSFGTDVYEALKTNTHCKEVSLSNCGLNNDFAKKLGSLLTTNKSLQKLNLESNSIGAEGTLALAEALKKNNTLLEVQLANQSTQCGNQAEMALAEMFDVNKVLIRFTLPIRNGGARTKIDHALTRNKELARQAKRAATLGR